MGKRIAVIATSVAIAEEKGLDRMFYLSEMLVDNGYEVEMITSDFQHWNKAHRIKKDIEKNVTKSKITLLHEPGYKRNTEPKRVYSHYIFALNLKKYLYGKEYDLIYSDLPDNHVSAICAKWAKKNGIPYIADIEDLWPKAMEMIFNVPIVKDLLFSYFSHDAKITYQLCSGVIGSSDTYRDDPLKYGIVVPYKETVYVGNDLQRFDTGAKKYCHKIRKMENDFWVTYAGTIGLSYDIKTMIDAADILARNKIEIKIILLGDGPFRSEFEEYAKKKKANIVFAGYQQYEIMAGYLVNSDILINSVKRNAPQSIVSKIGDYLAAGKPMINTCLDTEFWRKVEEDKFGINVEPENAEALAAAILYLKNNCDIRDAMGKKARIIAEKQFDRSKSFLKIVEMIDNLTASNV